MDINFNHYECRGATLDETLSWMEANLEGVLVEGGRWNLAYYSGVLDGVTMATWFAQTGAHKQRIIDMQDRIRTDAEARKD